MMRFTSMLLLLAYALSSSAAEPAAGRWEGVLDIPGRPIPLTIDLNHAGGAWTGSVTLTGLSLREQLTEIVVSDGLATFKVAKLLRTPEHGLAAFTARLQTQGPVATMSGEFTQAGNRAPFSLRRTGVAQVDAVPRSTAVAAALEGTWIGEYELGGYARKVTIKLANVSGTGTAEFVVVGKRTTNLPIDVVIQHGRYVRIESNDTAINYEGRVSPDGREIVGIFEQGPFEAALTLRRPQ